MRFSILRLLIATAIVAVWLWWLLTVQQQVQQQRDTWCVAMKEHPKLGPIHYTSFNGELFYGCSDEEQTHRVAAYLNRLDIKPALLREVEKESDFAICRWLGDVGLGLDKQRSDRLPMVVWEYFWDRDMLEELPKDDPFRQARERLRQEDGE